ncbi:MAG: matrixin family metalloprotease [Flavobacteriales bacterium]|nr:matrixin family metalloprotease [Flavobacteriales bacterium]
MKNLICFLSIAFVLISCEYNRFEFEQSKGKLVLIQPFEGIELALVDTVASALEDIYDIEVMSNDMIIIPKSTFVNIKSPRYRADSLIRFLKNSIYGENDCDYVIGLISDDISTTKYSDPKNKIIKEPESKYGDWGIYGLGYCPGPTCIVSTYRLGKSTTKENFILRLKKVSCHELGHNLGLPHCPNKNCIMQDAAETITTIDNVELTLCDDCKKKIGLE